EKSETVTATAPIESTTTAASVYLVLQIKSELKSKLWCERDTRIYLLRWRDDKRMGCSHGRIFWNRLRIRTGALPAWTSGACRSSAARPARGTGEGSGRTWWARRAPGCRPHNRGGARIRSEAHGGVGRNRAVDQQCRGCHRRGLPRGISGSGDRGDKAEY